MSLRRGIEPWRVLPLPHPKIRYQCHHARLSLPRSIALRHQRRRQIPRHQLARGRPGTHSARPSVVYRGPGAYAQRRTTRQTGMEAKAGVKIKKVPDFRLEPFQVEQRVLTIRGPAFCRDCFLDCPRVQRPGRERILGHGECRSGRPSVAPLASYFSSAFSFLPWLAFPVPSRCAWLPFPAPSEGLSDASLLLWLAFPVLQPGVWHPSLAAFGVLSGV